MLKTWRFGIIRIVNFNAIDTRFDNFIDTDILGEWAYYQLGNNGEIVAVEL